MLSLLFNSQVNVNLGLLCTWFFSGQTMTYDKSELSHVTFNPRQIESRRVSSSR